MTRPKSHLGETTRNAARLRAIRANVRQQRTLNNNRAITKFSAINYVPQLNYSNDPAIVLGNMTVVCPYCSALKFKNEPKGICCSQGKVKLHDILQPPEPLKSLLTGDHPKSKNFFRHIRAYNNAFQMTSFMSNQVTERGFMPTFKVQGQVYHMAGSLFPLQPNEPKFLQIYFIANPEVQSSIRCAIAGQSVDGSLIRQLQDMLWECNTYVQSFQAAVDSAPENVPDFNVVIHADRVPAGEHRGRYNAPSTTEVAVLISGQQFNRRDIVIHSRDDSLRRISEIHRSYDSLQYPLILCRGEDGYSINIPEVNPVTGEHILKTVSSMNYYAYRIMVRENSFNTILRYGMLTNQYLVDQYAKIESERLCYIRNNQSKLRVENYAHLQDALCGNEHANNIGQLMILPSSFIGGPRYLHEKTQDAMTYVRNYGKPDLFVTFTCNPNWPEIRDHINRNETPQDRYDIVNRVFHLKVQKLLFLVNKAEIFGSPQCHMYTVEWQKRGLPHIHLLVWLKSKLRSDQIDTVISAELPSKEEDPLLHEIVQKHMIHGPCGSLNMNSPCMREGACTKKYPKSFQSCTTTSDDGYPKYRRRSPVEGGHVTIIRNKHIDNRWVVPFNPVLLRIFDAHINVEICNSVKSIKYVCKYINKGTDQATFSLNSTNEIEQYQSGRYICTSEAVWRILSFNVHERAPAITHLAVHLENGQRVYFNESNVSDIVGNPRDTTLTAFFKLCLEDEFAKTLTYDKVPGYYTWNQNNRKFQRRKQGQVVNGHNGIKKTDNLGRVYVIHPNNTECFHLRMLLHIVKGPTSFRFLKTVEGVTYDTFQAACKALGLLEDDTHWESCLSEAVLYSSASSLRYLFSILIAFCQITSLLDLWIKYREYMSDDILHRLRVAQGSEELNYNQSVFDEALMQINSIVQSLTGKNTSDFGLPLPNNATSSPSNAEVLRETTYDQSQLLNIIREREPSLNNDQKTVYKTLLLSLKNKDGKIFFLDAPGGTGKTFLINLLLTKVRSDGNVALAVASSGIAATLLEGGRTAHTTFKLPLNISDDSTNVCNISKQSNTAKLIQMCSLIVWDEATMSHKASVEALDRTMRDLRNTNKPMGGCTVLFSGDFRQILPVVSRGTRADEVNASLKRSYLWGHIIKVALTINMRVLTSSEDNRQFADMLLKVGNGELPTVCGKISFNNDICVLVTDHQQLIDKIYPTIDQLASKPVSWLRERAILAPTNEQVEKINNLVLSKFHAQTREYCSVDSVVDCEEAVHYPTEFLNSMNPSGMPPHKLTLKVGAPIILLRNLNPPVLCNGTRLQVKRLHSYLVECTILTGCGTGKTILIPRIPMIPTDLPFKFKRLQFPVKVCFGMTINKAQGQTFNVTGVDLSTSCFSHGQLYVALSRVTSNKNLYVLAEGGNAHNIVYREIF